MGFEDDRKLEIKFMPTVKKILGLTFFQHDDYADINEGADFIILESKPIRVGYRIRRHVFFLTSKFRYQFTIRWSRPSGMETEIHKIHKGYVSHIFYGFLDKDEKQIIQYFIGDADYLRLPQYQNPVDIRQNKPPSDSELAIYNLNIFPKAFIIKAFPQNFEAKLLEIMPCSSSMPTAIPG